MTTIDYKSVGTLIDEMFTAQMKSETGNTNASIRVRALAQAIAGRLKDTPSNELIELMSKLKIVLRECWMAQEIVHILEHKYPGALTQDEIWQLAGAGVVAQRTNARRNKLIRAIDELVGEDNITQLGKTYG